MIEAASFPMRLGDSASRTRVFTEEDVAEYRDLAGDSGLLFGSGANGVPGPLLAGMISDLLGTTLPGLGTMWAKQELAYRGSASIGAAVTATVTITRFRPDKNLVDLHSECRCGGEVIVSGRTLVGVPDLASRV